MKGVTLGQFVPGDSPLHRLDARAKIGAVACFIVALFATASWWAYVLVAAVLVLCTALANAPLGKLWRGLRPIVFLLAITAVINALSVPGPVAFSLGPLDITRPGLAMAGRLGARLLLLVWSTTLMTLTTAPLALTDALERIFGPFKRLRLPVHEMALMMSIALRFIPTLFAETDRIMKAQMARGADLESGSLLRRGRSLIPVLVPLFVASFRRAEELALAMEARAYTGGEGRTHFRQPQFRAPDAVALGIALLVAAFAIVGGRWLWV